MAKKKTKKVATKGKTSAEELVDVDDESSDDSASIDDGKIVDYITGRQFKETPKEKVRQRIARAIFHEHGFSPDDMEPDFPVTVGGKRKKIDIAIFKTGSEHAIENLHRIVICKPEPKRGKKSSFKIRDHEQAETDLAELKDFMEAVESAQWGYWTNEAERFFVKKEQGRFEATFLPMGNWPLADESQGTKDVHSHARVAKTDPEALKQAFRRCHNYIHGNEGVAKDKAFWLFLYLIFAKMYDERQSNG
ncbi:MAG: type I restriction enzyme HsdR N-terminal domain-containing protein, partial [Pirellulaceae bacterium]